MPEFAGVCDNPLQAARKSLILNGEVSECSIEHAWKACSAARPCSLSVPTPSFPARANVRWPQPRAA